MLKYSLKINLILSNYKIIVKIIQIYLNIKNTLQNLNNLNTIKSKLTLDRWTYINLPLFMYPLYIDQRVLFKIFPFTRLSLEMECAWAPNILDDVEYTSRVLFTPKQFQLSSTSIFEWQSAVFIILLCTELDR